MLGVLAGDRAAYRTPPEHLRRRLGIFFARKLRETPSEVDDLLQEILIAIHAKREAFDRDQPFTPWAHATARYKLVDRPRRTRRGTTVPLVSAEELFGVDDSGVVDASRAPCCGA